MLPQNNYAQKSSYKILFVGNSLTYTNNLPELVKQEGQQQGLQLEAKMVAYPNYALIDHWDDGKVQEMIAQGNYDFVLIQQGPSSQRFGREVLFNYGHEFNTLCKASGAQLAYFMVWPSKRHYQTFDAIIKNHKDAAKSINAILCPVGEVWKQHFDETEDYSYYGPDGFHPSLEGSQIAAKVIVSSLF